MPRNERKGAFKIAWILFLILCAGCSEGKDSLNDPQSGDQTAKEESVTPTAERRKIWLESSSKENLQQVIVQYNGAENGQNPRVAEVFLRHSSNVKYKGVEKGEALRLAEKQLVVQEVEEGLLRVVILSSENTNTIDTGVLLTAAFEKTNNKAGKLEILTDQPLFAPEEANEGLLVGDPIEI
jgi:hypothetical protein